jgi:bifunctional DNA-binding transcriptional regulator/antitoxin component of YhaV-PrlF toxin-antitoxin module
MKITQISSGGQVQIPAEVRRRWGTRKLILEDAGSYIRIRPVPDDPISAVRGMFAGSGPSAAEAIRQLRQEDLAAEEAKWARHYGRDDGS